MTVLSLTASGANLLCTYVYIFVNPGATRTSSVVIFRTLCIRSVERRNPLIYYPILFHISTLWWSCSSILLSCLFRMSKYVGISYVLYEGIIVLKIYLKSWVPYSTQCHSPQWDIILLYPSTSTWRGASMCPFMTILAIGIYLNTHLST